MEEDDKGCPMIRMGVSGWMFLLVRAYPVSPGQKAVKRLCVCVWNQQWQVFIVISPPQIHICIVTILYNWPAHAPSSQKCPSRGGDWNPMQRKVVQTSMPPNGIAIGSAVLHSSQVCMTHTDTWATLRATCVGKGRIYATRCHTDLTLAKQKYQFIKFNA